MFVFGFHNKYLSGQQLVKDVVKIGHQLWSNLVNNCSRNWSIIVVKIGQEYNGYISAKKLLLELLDRY